MNKVVLLLSFCLYAYGQNGTPVRINDDPSSTGIQRSLGYSGTNIVYVCYSPSFASSGPRGPNGTASSLSGASSTQASPTVIAVTHQFALGTRPTITIGGVTGTGYSGINATWVGTVVDSTHISIPFDSSALSTATWTSGKFTTTAPRLNIPEWAVQINAFDGSNNLITIAWLGSTLFNPSSGGSTAYAAKCSDAVGGTEGVQ